NFGGGNPGGGNQGGGNQGGGNQGGGGVVIDANGVVTPKFDTGRSSALTQKRLEEAAKKALPSDLNKPIALRKVSLVQLEEVCKAYSRDKKKLPLDIVFLAGLQRIDYVFVYPETNDLVIAGPAEGFAPDATGRIVGVKSGRSPLRLDDLIVALRVARNNQVIGCSIDPVQQRIAQLQQYIQTNTGATRASVARARYKVMADILGLQDIRVFGVPEDSNFAEVMVEADIRMKRISLGLDMPRVRGLASSLALTRPGTNSMQRWWFSPLYEAFQKSVDGNAYQFAGQRAQLLSQEEIPNANGQIQNAAFTQVSTQKFAQNFTEKFPDLVEAVPVFAQLQNLFDLAVLSALLQKEKLPQRVGWGMSLFLDPVMAPIPKGTVPKHTNSIFNSKVVGGRTVIGLISGGVTINAVNTVNSLRVLDAKDGVLASLGKQSFQKKQDSKDIQWWWD
ncbi:MAG: DUF1598 domain-containing protein, partial [Planctomycetota bacterium]|nr:DUF1598 domain-containing protein [Planctomycetota bacterium]